MALILKVKNADFSDTGLNPIIPTINGFPKVGLLGLYMMDDDESSQVLADSSGNGNHIAKAALSKTAQGYAFDDTASAMNFPWEGNLKGTYAIAWHSKVPDGKSSNQNVIANRTIDDSAIYNVLYNTQDRLRLRCAPSLEIGINYSSENWHLATAWFDITAAGKECGVSVPNAGLVATSVNPSDRGYVAGRGSLGAQPSEGSSFSNAIYGGVGVVAIYDRVLSEEERVIVNNRINEIMNSRGVVLV